MLKQEALESLLERLERYIFVRKALKEVNLRDLGLAGDIALAKTEKVIREVAGDIAEIDEKPTLNHITLS